jgi:Family of unknown function (DUF6288)
MKQVQIRKQMNRIGVHVLRTAILVSAFYLSHEPAWAIFEKGDFPWKVKVESWQEEDMQQKLGPCWYLNVGPTGLRAQITHEYPCYFTIKYVFEKSPAAGKIKVGDIVIGANGTLLKMPHTFGRGNRVTGWDGPLVDMAKLIEDSQGKDGKLNLMVWPGGDKKKQATVPLQIEALGKFSPTYPFNCPRSDKLVKDTCDFLLKQYDQEGGFKKMVHTHSHCVLALMASGDKKYDSHIKRIMSGYSSRKYSSDNGNGFPCWGNGYDGIVMGEYYLRYKDKSMLSAMKSLAECYELSQDWNNGGFSHKPFPAIQQRVAAGGPKGYGPMAAPGGLAMLAMSLFKAGGLPYSESAYQRIHQSYLQSASPEGVNIIYGFPEWHHAVIALEEVKKGKSGKGIGYKCPTGMTTLGKYSITWPTKADPRWVPTDWVEDESKNNMVYEMGDNLRLVVRTMTLKEPSKSFQTRKGCAEAPVGLGALAHLVGNKDNPSWEYLGQHCASSCALAPRDWLQGHASSSMHQLWVALAAARAEEKEFRSFMEQVKWWFIMQQCHDGGFFILPDRDRDTNSDPFYGARNLPSANAAIILALQRRQLQITGADNGASTAKKGFTSLLTSKTAAASPVVPAGEAEQLRVARKVIPEGLAKLDKALKTTLVKLSDEDMLKPVPIPLSKTKVLVWLSKVEADDKLSYQTLDKKQTAVYQWTDLTPGDHAVLSRLVASLRPASKDCQAMAGTYMECLGRMVEAEFYYEKAGPEAKEKFDKVFEK